jgi:V/A-type H+-transporting ATPase subunit K
MEITITAAFILIAGMIALGIYGARRSIKKKMLKTLFGANIGIFFGLMIVTTIVLLSGNTAGAAAEAVGGGLVSDNSRYGIAYLSAAISTGLATIGAGIAVAMTGSAALGAISEDQSLLGKSLIIVGLAEGIAIYGLIVSILILGYVG